MIAVFGGDSDGFGEMNLAGPEAIGGGCPVDLAVHVDIELRVGSVKAVVISTAAVITGDVI